MENRQLSQTPELQLAESLESAGGVLSLTEFNTALKELPRDKRKRLGGSLPSADRLQSEYNDEDNQSTVWELTTSAENLKPDYLSLQRTFILERLTNAGRDPEWGEGVNPNYLIDQYRETEPQEIFAPEAGTVVLRELTNQYGAKVIEAIHYDTEGRLLDVVYKLEKTDRPTLSRDTSDGPF